MSQINNNEVDIFIQALQNIIDYGCNICTDKNINVNDKNDKVPLSEACEIPKSRFINIEDCPFCKDHLQLNRNIINPFLLCGKTNTTECLKFLLQLSLIDNNYTCTFKENDDGSLELLNIKYLEPRLYGEHKIVYTNVPYEIENNLDEENNYINIEADRLCFVILNPLSIRNQETTKLHKNKKIIVSGGLLDIKYSKVSYISMYN